MSEQTQKFTFGKDYLHPCALHIDELEVDISEYVPYCPDCGKTLELDSCLWCGAIWIVFGNGWDDVMAQASITEDGDLVCADCAREYAREYEYDSEDDLEVYIEEDEWEDDLSI